MDKKKLSVMECLDKDVLEFFDEGVVARMDRNNKDDFDVGFLLAKHLV